MYYKFNGLTQKLTGSAPLAAYNPQGLKPQVPSESPPLIFASPTTIAAEGIVAPPKFMVVNKVAQLQQHFQKPDGLPVHLKGGAMDKLLYRTTMTLAIGGSLYCLVALYMAAQPTKK